MSLLHGEVTEGLEHMQRQKLTFFPISSVFVLNVP